MDIKTPNGPRGSFKLSACGPMTTASSTKALTPRGARVVTIATSCSATALPPAEAHQHHVEAPLSSDNHHLEAPPSSTHNLTFADPMPPPTMPGLEALARLGKADSGYPKGKVSPTVSLPSSRDDPLSKHPLSRRVHPSTPRCTPELQPPLRRPIPRRC